MPRVRLDQLVADRRLSASRERARALILAGQVTVGGDVVTKAGAQVDEAAEIALVTPDHPYVGRGGLKLAHALDTFQIAVAGRDALDIGASTGGFTDVLLQRGAARVIALDVGHGQLDWTLRQDARVEVREHVNARYLTPADFSDRFDLVVVDVSFLSLKKILPVIPPLMADGALVITLIKPQFEVGKGEVGKGGIVRERAAQQRVVEEIIAFA